MIIIRLSGGLGNQMFQYALFLKLKSMGKDVKFDDWTEYKLDNARPIMLSVFGIDYPKATEDEVREMTDSSLKIRKKITRKLFGRKNRSYFEASSEFDPKVLEQDSVYLCGCFQSERYFKDLEAQIRQAFDFRNMEIPGNLKDRIENLPASYQKQIETSESVCIHIRRGDYLKVQEVYGGICTDEYYDSAVRYIDKRVKDAKFFVFTNDTEWALNWCKKRKDSHRFTVIEGTTEETGYLDLMLMSKCRHHIIANSSFSWWGAWLGHRITSVAIAPAVWFADRVCEDIYTDWMVRLDAAGRIQEEEIAGEEDNPEAAKETGNQKGKKNAAKGNEEETEKPLVSVIVAVYNIEDYLPRCLDSVCGQTYKHLEIILVDDGSTDTSGAVCEHYALHDARVMVIHKENGGLSDARNAGLSAAKGDYIGFVDGDDWIEPQMYEAMVTGCVENNAQIAVCRYKQITKRGIIDASTDHSVLLTRNEALEIYVCGHDNYLIYNSVWSKLFAREVIAGMEFPVGKKSEDIMFTTKAFCKMNRCFYLDQAYYNYVMDREGSIMNQGAGERRLQDEIPFWQEQIDWLRKSVGDEIADKAAYHFFRRLLFYYLDFMQSPDMRKFGNRIVRLLREDQERIRYIYKKEFVTKGDRSRMHLMLSAPRLYYYIVRVYDSVVVPLRNRLS